LWYACACAIFPPATAIAESEIIIQEALSQADNPHHSAITCTAGTVYDTYLYILTFTCSLPIFLGYYTKNKCRELEIHGKA